MLPTVATGYAFVLPMLSALASLSLLGIAHFHGRKSTDSRFLATYFVVNLVVLMSSLFLSLPYTKGNVLLVNQLIYLGVIFLPIIAYHVCVSHSSWRVSKFLIVGYGSAMIFALFLWSPLFIHTVKQYAYGCYAQAGILHHMFIAYVCIVLGHGLYVVGRKYSASHDEAQRISLIRSGLFLSSVLLLLSLLILPAYGIPSFLFLYVMAPLLAAINCYAALYENRFRLRIVIIQTFAVYVVVVSCVHIFLVDSPQLRLSATIISVFVALFGILVTQNTMVEFEMREKGERLARYLANANSRLRNLDKQKTDFVSIASHQLRGPISTITGYTSLIQDGSYGLVNEKLNEPLVRIFESGRRLSMMVDDLLNVTRIEQGLMLYRKTATDMIMLLQAALEKVRPIAEGRGLTLTFTPPAEGHVILNVDTSKFALVFQSILDNAVKFTPKGTITVSVQVSEMRDRIFITFSDTGVGISHNDISNLFTKFNRASNANTASVYGSGLGLYIAQEIVKAHEGLIHVSSRGSGYGTTLTIELPIRSVPRGLKP